MSARVQNSMPSALKFSIPMQWGVAILGVVLATAVNVLVFLPQILANETGTVAPPPPWTDPETNIELFAPVADVTYHSPIDVTGFSRTFEGNVVIRLRDSNDQVIAERVTIGGSHEGFDFFHTYLRFTTVETQAATLEVLELSADDDSVLTEIQVPITIRPGQRWIDLHTPEVGANVCSPVTIAGYSSTFESNVYIDLRARDGTLIEEGFAQGGTQGVYADFVAALEHQVHEPQPILISAYEISADTGEWFDLARVPATLYPAETEICP